MCVLVKMFIDVDPKRFGKSNLSIYRQNSNVCHQHTSEKLKLLGNLADHLKKISIKVDLELFPEVCRTRGICYPPKENHLQNIFEYKRENSIPTT